MSASDSLPAGAAASAAGSQAYTYGHPPTVVAWHSQRSVQQDVPYVAPYLKAGDALLDVGCGPGSITVDFVAGGYIDPAHPHGGSVTGVEPAPAPGSGKADVLEQARAHAAERLKDRAPEVRAGVRFVHGSVFALPFPDASFDVVHTHAVLCHLQNEPLAIREMIRVLKPGGLLAMREGEWAPSYAYPSMDRWIKLMRDEYASNGAFVPGSHAVHAWLRRAAEESSPSVKLVPDLLSSYTATPIVRAWSNATQCAGGGAMAGRPFAENMRARLHMPEWRAGVLKKGIVPDESAIDECEREWQRWIDDPDALFTIQNVDVLAWKAK